MRRRVVTDDRGDPADDPRPLLGIVPYALLMVGLAVMAIGIMIVAWPGNQLPVKEPQATTVEVGNAPKGWMPKQ